MALTQATPVSIPSEMRAGVEDISAVETAYEESEKKLIEFVTKNLEVMKAKLLTEKYPTLAKLNEAYIEYTPVLLSLTSLYEKVKFSSDQAQKELELFESQALACVKELCNRADNKNVWYSANELKALAHTQFKSKFSQLKAKVALAEGRRSYIERLCKAWDSWQFGLGQISRNLIAEANANGLDMKGQSRMPIDPDDYAVNQVMANTLN